MAEQKIEVNINQLEILAPVISACLVNAILTNELIRIQGGSEVPIDDFKSSTVSILSFWQQLTESLRRRTGGPRK